jgi:hypothetical protein
MLSWSRLAVDRKIAWLAIAVNEEVVAKRKRRLIPRK